jgi:hypothetical protein
MGLPLCKKSELYVCVYEFCDTSDPDVIIKIDISNAFNVVCRAPPLDVSVVVHRYSSIYSGSILFVHFCCLYVPVWVRYNHGPLVQGSWRPQCERISSQVVMLHRRCAILCLMSLIEGRPPAQRCVIVLEHPAPARHTALCRYAARFALFVS